MALAPTADRSFFDAIVGEPFALAKSQPHQILLSAGSVVLMGQFAGSSQIVPIGVGYAIAIGVEWAYLRGLASDSRAQTRWGGILNWSAFFIVVLWGVLWCAQILHVFDEAGGGWWLAAAHVIPVAWLSLCSAQCHRAALAAEQVQARTLDKERLAWEQAQEEEDRKLNRWKEAQRFKTELKLQERSVTETPVTPTVTSLSHPVTTPNRADLRAAVVTAYKTHGLALNVSQEAKQLGIGRGQWYKLRNEAIAAGEL